MRTFKYSFSYCNYFIMSIHLHMHVRSQIHTHTRARARWRVCCSFSKVGRRFVEVAHTLLEYTRAHGLLGVRPDTHVYHKNPPSSILCAEDVSFCSCSSLRIWIILGRKKVCIAITEKYIVGVVQKFPAIFLTLPYTFVTFVRHR